MNFGSAGNIVVLFNKSNTYGRPPDLETGVLGLVIEKPNVVNIFTANRGHVARMAPSEQS